MAELEMYKTSFEAMHNLKETLSCVANKNKISAEALIVLLALNCGTDLSFFVKDEFVQELIKLGFVKIENANISITGKGAILAKSLERII